MHGRMFCRVLQDDMTEKETVDQLPADWDDVILKSKNVDISLKIVKRKFTKAIQTWLHI